MTLNISPNSPCLSQSFVRPGASEGLDSVALEMSKAALSNLMGSIGYSYGSSKVDGRYRYRYHIAAHRAGGIDSFCHFDSHILTDHPYLSA